MSVFCLSNADIVKLLPSCGTGIVSVFFALAPLKNSKGNPLNEALNDRGGKIFRISTEVAVYLGNGVR